MNQKQSLETIIAVTTEGIVIDYANLSGRESINRAEFKRRTEVSVTEAIKQAIQTREKEISEEKKCIHQNKIDAFTGDMDEAYRLIYQWKGEDL